MSILGIQRQCDGSLEQGDTQERRSLLRRVIKTLTVGRYPGEPIAEDGELYGRAGRKHPRGLEGRPLNTMMAGSSNEGMQEPFEAFVMVEPTLSEGPPVRPGQKEVVQDDMRIDGLSMPRSFGRFRQHCRQGTAEKSTASTQRVLTSAYRRWRDVERETRDLFVALGSVDDSVITAAAIAIGIVVLVLLSFETALGPRRLRARQETNADFESSANSPFRKRYHKRLGGRRSVSSTLLVSQIAER